MRIIVWKPPRILRGVLRAAFGAEEYSGRRSHTML